MAYKDVERFTPDRPKNKTKIGSFGGVTFHVSYDKILTFDDFKRTETSRWQVHDTARGKPLAEFNGQGQEDLTFQLVLKRAAGVAPWTISKKLRTMQHKGKISAFMIGKKTIANNKFYIDSINESYKHIDNHGQIDTIIMDISIKEYTKITSKRKKQSSSKKSKNGKKNESVSSKKQTGTATVKVSHLNVRSSPSLKGKIKKVVKSGQKMKVYGTKKADGITWYNLGNGLWCSAVQKYTQFTPKK